MPSLKDSRLLSHKRFIFMGLPSLVSHQSRNRNIHLGLPLFAPTICICTPRVGRTESAHAIGKAWVIRVLRIHLGGLQVSAVIHAYFCIINCICIYIPTCLSEYFLVLIADALFRVIISVGRVNSVFTDGFKSELLQNICSPPNNS